MRAAYAIDEHDVVLGGDVADLLEDARIEPDPEVLRRDARALEPLDVVRKRGEQKVEHAKSLIGRGSTRDLSRYERVASL